MKIARVDSTEDFDTGVLLQLNKQRANSVTPFFSTPPLSTSLLPPVGGTITCITLYNESVDELRQSLMALALAIDNHNISEQLTPLVKVGISNSNTIAIIADGFENLSDESRQLLFEIGFPAIKAQDISSDIAIFFQYSSIGKLFSILSPESIVDPSVSDCVIPLFICIKKHNAGKLDSHWWYYRFLCPLLDPAYCFQMDTGTVPTPESFHTMVAHFSANPWCAALASNVAITPPSNCFDALQIWQYCSFQQGLLLDWPAEEWSGYLSVIPGQYSGVRWQALRDTPSEYNKPDEIKELLFEADPLETAQRQSQPTPLHRQPLDIYFRGLGELEPLEAIVYLAEDRVLCNEVAFRDQGRWRLEYVDDAVAITDACTNLQELLRQRRRWYGSYIACRIKFIHRLQTAFKGSEITRGELHRLSVAGIYQAIQLLLDWFFPALLLVIYLSINTFVKQHSNQMLKEFFSALGLIMTCMIILQFLFCMRSRLDKFALGVFWSSIWIQFTYIASAAIVLVLSLLKNNFSILHAQFFLLLFSLPIAAALKSPGQLWPIFKYFLLHSALRPTFALLFWMYAFCNAHDNSWGTKGLHQPTYTTASSPGRTTRENYIGFRNSLLAGWLATNCLLALGMWISFHQAHIFLLNLVMGILTVNVIFSMLAILQKKTISKWRMILPIFGRYSSSVNYESNK